MSASIDERVVAMKFNNGQFQTGVADSLKSLDSLKKGLNLDSAKKGLEELAKTGNGFTLGPLGAAAQGVSAKFIALATIGITALANITSAAISTGVQLVRSLTIAPITDGLREYETNLNSIQTILANTQSKGTNLSQVNEALQELNTYSDKTIYNFSQMARNIGTFTAAGVDLKTSTLAIKGIANLAALSGSNAYQAATAMDQLSQALSSGSVHLMDWNSVVNAGMGGQVFQDAIKETARSMGVGVDAIIKKNGSFRESLQDGWLTSDILTKTLSKFTGDMNAEQLKAQGYTDTQIVSIMKLAQTATDAATKVKTASQLIGTLQESVGSGWGQTFQLILGDFEEAPKLFTAVNNVLGGMISAQAAARNKMLTDWKALGGRDSAINAVANAFHAVMSVIEPLKKAFTDIFPPATGEQLAHITKGIEAFTKGLILGKDAQEKLHRTFKGLFALLDIGVLLIQGLIAVFQRLFGSATKGAGGILDVTANIGDFIVKVRDALLNGDGLYKFFHGLGNVLEVPIQLFRGLIGLLVLLATSIAKADFSGFADTFGKAADRIKDHLKPLVEFGNGVAFVFNHIVDALKVVAKFFEPIARTIGNAAKGLFSSIKDSFSESDFNGVLDIVNTGLLAGIIVLVKKFIDTITKKFKGFDISGGLMGTIKGAFGQLTNTLSAMQGQLKAKTLMLIAAAIGILTVSVIALSMIDSAKLASALTGLTVMFGQMIGGMALLDKFTSSKGFLKMPVVTATLILFGIAVGIMTSAVKRLADLDWNGLAKGLTGLTIILGELILVTKTMENQGPKFVTTAVGLGLLAIAVRILASAVTELAGNSWEDLAKGLGGVAVVLAILAGFTQIVGSPKRIIATSVAMIALGTSLLIIGNAVKIFADLDWNMLARGLVGMAVALGIVAGAMKIMPPSMILTAPALVVVAAALVILATALKMMAGMTWEEIGKGMVVLAGSLIILAAAMSGMLVALPGAAALVIASVGLIAIAAALKIMTTLSWDDIGRAMTVLGASMAILAVSLTLMVAALPGAAALLVAAGALMILAPALLIMGNMSWEVVVRGLATMAAAIAILGVAGYALIPALPGLFGLGAAVLLLGVGAMAAGLGVLALSVGLTALSVAGGAAIAILVAAVSALAGLIPFVATQIGLGILAIAKVIGDGGPEILLALTTILLALIAAIVKITPPLIDAAVLLVIKLVAALVKLIPLLVDAGMKLIIGILDGVAKNIGKVVEKGTDIVVAFIEGVGKSIPRLMQAGVNLILDFINGLANTIRNNTEKVNAAGNNLADAIIDGMTSGIRNGVNNVIKAITGIAGAAINAAKKLLGIHSPSKVFREIGAFTSEGMAIGITSLKGAVVDAAGDVGDSAVDAVRDSISGMSKALSGNVDMTPTIRPVLDLSAIKKDGALISGMLGTPTMSLDSVKANVTAASVGYESTHRVATDADGTPVVGVDRSLTFNQYNNSPKALSAAEIYRQTKSQLSVTKGELDK